MVMKHRIIVNKYNSDIKCMVTVVALMPFIVMTLVGMLNSFEYAQMVVDNTFNQCGVSDNVCDK